VSVEILSQTDWRQASDLLTAASPAQAGDDAATVICDSDTAGRPCCDSSAVTVVSLICTSHTRAAFTLHEATQTHILIGGSSGDTVINFQKFPPLVWFLNLQKTHNPNENTALTPVFYQ